ncbi:dockerin type I domain-containing protein [Patescibacteria group bacterium]
MALGVHLVSAIDVSVSATVPSDPPIIPDTIVQFSGYAYPGADITIRQNGSVLATTVANPQANFNVSKKINPGTYTFAIFGEDDNGLTGRVFNITLSITEGATTTISGIFLGPTIDADKSTIEIGETITILGTTVPNSTVLITVNSNAQISSLVTALNDGSYSDQFIGGLGGLDIDTHSARSKATAPDNSISENSNTISFAVVDQDVCATASPGDINCDGFVNLVDFSIFLFYWGSTNPAEPRADINNDGRVDIIDFSVMLFYWTG